MRKINIEVTNQNLARRHSFYLLGDIFENKGETKLSEDNVKLNLDLHRDRRGGVGVV